LTERGHRPRRTCLGCGVRDDQSNLMRLVVVEHGGLQIQMGKGRGGYLHSARECWQAFVRRKSLYRAFRLEITKDAKEKFVRELQTHGE